MANNIFTKNVVENVHFSNHNLSHEVKMSFDAGFIIPVGQPIECLPNDRFSCSTEAFIQMAPMLYPVMHRINLKLYNFFVPYRLLWKYWQKFFAEEEKSVMPTKPLITGRALFQNNQLDTGTLSDYLGFPVKNFLGINYQELSEAFLGRGFDAMPFLAYQLIYNDYFRDENLEENLFDDDEEDDSIVEKSLFWNGFMKKGIIDSETALSELFRLRRKAWEKDYFTSPLPEPQYGDPVPVPVAGIGRTQQGYTSPVVSLYNDERVLPNTVQLIAGYPEGFSSGSGYRPLTLGQYTETSDDLRRSEINPPIKNQIVATTGGIPVIVDNVSFTIADLRLASAIQRMQEALARGGHRYKEVIISLYNQITPDFRLDRPEFLSACTVGVTINSIEQTSETATTPQGNLAGRGTVYGGNDSFRYHCKEHGFIFTLATVLPRSSYCQGLSKIWTRLDRYDYHNRYFENLGDQEVKNEELYFDGSDSSEHHEAFGYAPRFAEYKYMPSTTHGDFLDTLDFMTLTRMFGSRPNLNNDFIRVDDATVNRAFAVQTNVNHLYATFYRKIHARRPMQSNPIPKLI